MSYAHERARREKQLLWSAGFFAGVGHLSLSPKRSLLLELKLTTKHAALDRFMLPLDDLPHTDRLTTDMRGRTQRRIRFTGQPMQLAMARLEPYLDDDRLAEWRALQEQWQLPYTVREALRTGFSAGRKVKE